MENINKIGVVLLNLGGPDSIQAVKPFLFNLFSDREIIRLGPPFLQKPIAWFISSIRSKKTKQMYSQIGGKSPIFDITTAQAAALEKALNEPSAVSRQPLRSFKVYIGMRYWRPFIKDTVDKIIQDGVKHLIVLSLYPHYSKATTGSSVSEFRKYITGRDISVHYIEQWYDFPPYIDSLAELIADGINEFKGRDIDILYSAHSLPESFIKEGDPYLDHIKATITAVNSSLATRHSILSSWHLAFQSKTGPVKWLEPTTGETIKKLANEGCKDLFVVPISFVSDHIETLYEIDILYRNIAEGYGINLRRCKALNTFEKFILAMKQLIMAKIT